MTFRRQLLLSLAVLVIVPALIAAVAISRVVTANENAKTDARLESAVRVGGVLVEQYERRMQRRVDLLQDDTALRRAVETGDPEQISETLSRLIVREEFAGATARLPGRKLVTVGAGNAIGVARVRVPSRGGETVLLSFGLHRPSQLINEVDTNTGVAVALQTQDLAVIDRAAHFPDASDVDLRSVPATTSGRWRTQRLAVLGLDRAAYSAVFALAPTTAVSALGPRLVLVALIAFLIVGLTIGLVLMRSLRGRIQTFLDAADRLGSGDFSAAATIDVRGGDEFAQLGQSFIGMARQVDQRVDQLERERGRVQNSLLRIGKAFGATLDRDRLVELLVESAVDGLTGDSGRALLPPAEGGAPVPVCNAGEVLEAWDVLTEVERTVLQTGRSAVATAGGMHAIAEPLRLERADDTVIGVISVARQRPFEPDERELLTYLTQQASVSLRNVGRHEDISRESITDELTGLANRRRFDDVLSQAAGRATADEPIALVMLDLDRFKVLNDTYGHQFGDTVLRAVAEVVRESARDRDLPARYGGEELAVVLAQGGSDGAREYAERLRESIEALELGDERTGPVKVTASIGVAALPGDGDDVNDLVRAADEALYRAKRGGRNRVERATPPQQPNQEVR